MEARNKASQNTMSNRFLTVLRQSGGKVFLTGAVLIVLLVLAGLFANSVDFEEQFRGVGFSSDPGTPLYLGPFGYAVMGALAICFTCPRQVVSFFAGYFFGLWLGIFIGLAATVLGCVISFSVARLFKERFMSLVTGKLRVTRQFWSDNPFFMTLIIRLMPAGSNLLINLAAGALGIPALRFIVGSAIGYIPLTAIFAIIGSGVKVESGEQLALSIGLFVVSVAMGLGLYARYRKKIVSTEGSQ